MADLLAGRVAAVLCSGTEVDREITLALAEAGADIAIGTLHPSQEFATASIANEVWAAGRQQCSTVLAAGDPVALAAFAAETVDRLGRCDLLVVSSPSPLTDLEGVSPSDWEESLHYALTVPLFAAQAFQPVIERDGGGWFVFVHGTGEGFIARLTAGTNDLLAEQLGVAWSKRGLKVIAFPSDGAAEEIPLLFAPP